MFNNNPVILCTAMGVLCVCCGGVGVGMDEEINGWGGGGGR